MKIKKNKMGHAYCLSYVFRCIVISYSVLEVIKSKQFRKANLINLTDIDIKMRKNTSV